MRYITGMCVKLPDISAFLFSRYQMSILSVWEVGESQYYFRESTCLRHIIFRNRR